MFELCDRVALKKTCTCACEGCVGWMGTVVQLVPFMIVHWTCNVPFKRGKKEVRYREYFIWYFTPGEHLDRL